jgi:hypothetical protein
MLPPRSKEKSMNNFPQFIKDLDTATNGARKADDLAERSLSSKLGVVVENDDPEGLRRIRCSFPDNPYLATYWFFRLNNAVDVDAPVPRVGHTVLVTFIDGDITKGCYQPITNAKNPSHSEIKENPLIDSSRVVFGNDYANINQSQEANVGENLHITVGTDYELTVSDKVTISAGGGTKIEMKPDGTITLTAPTKIELATPSVNISADGGGQANMNFNADEISFTSTNSFTVNGKAIATIGAVDNKGDYLVSKGW